MFRLSVDIDDVRAKRGLSTNVNFAGGWSKARSQFALSSLSAHSFALSLDSYHIILWDLTLNSNHLAPFRTWTTAQTCGLAGTETRVASVRFDATLAMASKLENKLTHTRTSIEICQEIQCKHLRRHTFAPCGLRLHKLAHLQQNSCRNVQLGVKFWLHQSIFGRAQIKCVLFLLFGQHLCKVCMYRVCCSLCICVCDREFCLHITFHESHSDSHT